LILNEETVLPYLDFYLIFVRMDVGEINIIGDRDQYNILEEFPKETNVHYDEDKKAFVIKIPLYFDGTLMEGTVEILQTGEVMITDTKLSVQTLRNSIDYDSTTDY